MKPPENKKSIYYITVNKVVTTVEHYCIKHGNRVAAEKLAKKNKVKPYHTAQFSNHRTVLWTAEIPEDVLSIEPIDGTAVDG